MHSRNTEIKKIYSGIEFVTYYLRSECYCKSKEVVYPTLKQNLQTKNIPREKLIDSNNKVRTDLKGDIINTTGEEYDMLEDNTIVAAWYEICDD